MSKHVRKQECIKKLSGGCHLCDEQDYHVLDTHRILPGRDGGTYNEANAISVCCKCHRRIECGEIEILGRYKSSRGRWVLHIKKGGQEDWIWQPNILDS